MAPSVPLLDVLASFLLGSIGAVAVLLLPRSEWSGGARSFIAVAGLLCLLGGAGLLYLTLRVGGNFAIWETLVEGVVLLGIGVVLLVARAVVGRRSSEAGADTAI